MTIEKIISEKIRNLKPSPTLGMSEISLKLKSLGKDIIDLSLGEPDFKTPSFITEYTKNQIDTELFFSYPPVCGYKDLREKISEKLFEENFIECSFKNILVSNGVRQCLALVLNCLLEKDDEVIVFTPYWPSYKSLIELHGGKIVEIFGNFNNSFEPSLFELDKKINSKTKAILFSNPSNPTGAILDKKYLISLAQMLQKYPNLFVISDEICEYISFYEKVFSIGSLNDIKNRVITLNGFSKSYAMTGWRVGYMCADEFIIDSCKKIQEPITAGICGISQRAAFAAISARKNFDVLKMTSSYKERSEYIYNFFLKNTNIKPIKPKGAIYMFLNIEEYLNKKDSNGKIIENCKEFAMFLLNEAQVSTVSGHPFGIEGYVRICYAQCFERLKKACDKISEALKQLY